MTPHVSTHVHRMAYAAGIVGMASVLSLGIARAVPAQQPGATSGSATGNRAATICSVAVRSLNLRSGAGTAYARVGVLRRGARLTAIARTADGAWIKGRAGAPVGWAAAAFLDCGGARNVSGIPVAVSASIGAAGANLAAPNPTATIVWLRSGEAVVGAAADGNDDSRAGEPDRAGGVATPRPVPPSVIPPSATPRRAQTSAPPIEPPEVPVPPATQTTEPTDVPAPVPADRVRVPPPKPDAARFPGGPPLGYVKGVAFIDENANGVLDHAEPGLNDVEIYLDGGGLQLRQITPGTGAFSFDGLGAGVYDVYIKPGSEWTVTTPARYAVELGEGGVVMGADFGLVRHGGDTDRAVAQVVLRLPSTGLAGPSSVAFGAVVAALLAVIGVLGAARERRGG